MDFLSLLTQIPGMVSNFQGSSSPYLKQQKELTDRQNQISSALTDTNNPLYQQLYGQYKQQNQNNLAQVIAEAQGQNRMNSNMGRTPLFNQERGSENIFRTLAQNYQNQGVQADTQTRNALGQALSGASGAQGAYGNLTPYANSVEAQKIQGFKDIYGVLNNGAGSYQSPYQQPQQQAYNPGPITWNQPRGSYGQ